LRLPLAPPAWVVDDARAALPDLLDRRRALRTYIAAHRDRIHPGLHAFACELLELRSDIRFAIQVVRATRPRGRGVSIAGAASTFSARRRA